MRECFYGSCTEEGKRGPVFVKNDYSPKGFDEAYYCDEHMDLLNELQGRSKDE